MSVRAKKIITALLVISGLLLLLVVFGVLAVGKAFDELEICSKEIIKEQSLHNGGYKAIAYIENCGATTEFSPKVAIVKNINEVHMKNIVFIGEDTLDIDIFFDSEKNILYIRHGVGKEKIFKNETRYKDIEIKYEYHSSQGGFNEINL